MTSFPGSRSDMWSELLRGIVRVEVGESDQTKQAEPYPAEKNLVEGLFAGILPDFCMVPELRDRTLRGRMIRNLLQEPALRHVLARKGLVLQGVFVEGWLDLANLDLPFPLEIFRSEIPAGIALTSASTRTIKIVRSRTGPISANGCKVDGSFMILSELTDEGEPLPETHTTVLGGISLLGARVSRDIRFEGLDVRCRDAVLEMNGIDACDPENPYLYRDAAINADDVSATNVFFRRGFVAYGEVRLTTAQIDADLNLEYGTFVNSRNRAIDARGCRIGGNAFLFSSRYLGMVELGLAKIEGNLLAHGARIYSAAAARDVSGDGRGSDLPEGLFGCALAAEELEVRGHVDLRSPNPYCRFIEPRIARIALPGAIERLFKELDNSLWSDWNQTRKTRGTSKLDRTPKDGGGAVPRPADNPWSGFAAVGEVRLIGCRVAGDFDGLGASISALPARAERPGGGGLRLDRAEIEGTLFLNARLCPECRPQPFWTSGVLELQFARVGRFVDTPYSWPLPGKLSIEGFRYGAIQADEVPEMEREWLHGALRRDNRRTHWLALHADAPGREHSPDPYRQLAGVMSRAGDSDGAKFVLIENERRLFLRALKHAQRRLKEEIRFWDRPKSRLRGLFTLPFRCIGPGCKWASLWAWRVLWGSGVSFGYRPERALTAMLAFVLCGGLVFSINRDAMVPAREMVYLAESFRSDRGRAAEASEARAAAFPAIPPEYPEFQPFIYSLETFVPVLDLHQERYWIPGGTSPRAHMLHWYLWIHICVGWIVTSLALVAFASLARSERHEQGEEP